MPAAARIAVLVVTSLNKPQYLTERAIPLAENVAAATPGLHFFASDTPDARAEAERRGCVFRPFFAGDAATLACPELKGAPLTLVECADVKWGAAGPCCKADAALARWRRDVRRETEYVILTDDDVTWDPTALEAGLDDFSRPLAPDALWVSGNRAHGAKQIFWRARRPRGEASHGRAAYSRGQRCPG